MLKITPKDAIQDILQDLLLLNRGNTALFSFALYSVAAIHGLTSLFNSDGSEAGISREKIILAMRKIILALNTDNWINNLIPEDMKTPEGINLPMEEVILEIYRKTGCFYTQKDSYHIPLYEESIVSGITFIRGAGYQSDIKMSGAGLYKLSDNNTSTPQSLREMFSIPHQSNNYYFEALCNNLDFTELTNSTDIMYFNPLALSKKELWIKENNFVNGEISVLRVQHGNTFRNYLYKYDSIKKIIKISLLSETVLNNSFKRIVWAITEKNLKRQYIRYRTVNELVLVDIPYFFPDEEMMLFALYSWQRKSKGNFYARLFIPKVFAALKETMEEIGYVFKEVQEL